MKIYLNTKFISFNGHLDISGFRKLFGIFFLVAIGNKISLFVANRFLEDEFQLNLILSVHYCVWLVNSIALLGIMLRRVRDIKGYEGAILSFLLYCMGLIIPLLNFALLYKLGSIQSKQNGAIRDQKAA